MPPSNALDLLNLIPRIMEESGRSNLKNNIKEPKKNERQC